MSVLRTDFSGAFNAALFAKTETAGTVTQTGGEMLFNYNTGYPGICYVDDVTAIDMTGENAVIEMSTFPTSGPCYMRHYVMDATGKGWGTNFTYSTTASGALSIMKIVGGVATTFSSLGNYDNVSHKFMRLREASGTVYLDRSPDGTTWTNVSNFTIASQISGVNLTAMKARFGQTDSDGNGIYGVTNYWAPAIAVASTTRRHPLLTTRRARTATVSRIVTRAWAGPPKIASIPIGPAPDASTSGFGRRRTATYIRRNADFANRST